MWSQVHVTPSQQESSKLIFFFLLPHLLTLFLGPDSGKKKSKKLCTVLKKGTMNWLMDISCWMGSEIPWCFYEHFTKHWFACSSRSSASCLGGRSILVLHKASEKKSRAVIKKWEEFSENISRKIFNLPKKICLSTSVVVESQNWPCSLVVMSQVAIDFLFQSVNI